MSTCAQCVRVRLAVPEAVHQLGRIPGLRLERSDGVLAEGNAHPAAIRQLRQHPLVRSVEVLGQARPPERLEPLTATIGTGLVQLLRSALELPGVQVGLVALLLYQVACMGKKP